MDANEVRLARDEMEKSILTATNKAIIEFNLKTGISVCGIYISIAEVNTLGSSDKQFFATSVSADIRI
jgi:hypothetical protein